jgi:hypothetical protein
MVLGLKNFNMAIFDNKYASKINEHNLKTKVEENGNSWGVTFVKSGRATCIHCLSRFTPTISIDLSL